MPDITMCSNENCQMKNSCLRHTAPPDKYQSWSDFGGFCNEGTNYSYYMLDWRTDLEGSGANACN